MPESTSGSDSTRVAVFVDYQNTWHTTRALFVPTGSPSWHGHVHPELLGELLCQRGLSVDPARRLDSVQVYRGQPGPRSSAKLRSAFAHQKADWEALDDVSVHTRPMRYWPAGMHPDGRQRWRAEEKGVDVLLALHLALGAHNDLYDVAVVVSADTDLLPAVEEAVRLGKRVETATWWAPPEPHKALRIPGRQLWNHYLDAGDFAAVRDDTDYLAGP
ncbi:NYN domain-containing protein [Candidatus Poriferisodalis sp.]|uniref:NYN domain-containing protein n=1 Tax=Candidatus Poriferisodalis sp. TaxID=3101277 RepID=UPI003C70497D